MRLDRGEAWERDELAPLRGLEHLGLRDLFRDLHGYGRKAISFAAGARGKGWRLDHMVGSRQFMPVACEYDEAPRLAGLSDHAPMWAELLLEGTAEPAQSG